MTMPFDIERAVSFIGYAAAHPQLEDFLRANGVKRRLSGKDRPLTTVHAENNSVHLPVEEHDIDEPKNHAFREAFGLTPKKKPTKPGGASHVWPAVCSSTFR